LALFRGLSGSLDGVAQSHRGREGGILELDSLVLCALSSAALTFGLALFTGLAQFPKADLLGASGGLGFSLPAKSAPNPLSREDRSREWVPFCE